IIQILLTDSEVARAFELRSVVTVCDGVHGASHLTVHDESVKQAAVADVLIVSKRDVAEAGALATLSQRLAALNPGARQIHAVHGDVDPLHLECGGYTVARRSADAQRWLGDDGYALTTPPAAADPSIRSFALTHEKPITIPGL